MKFFYIYIYYFIIADLLWKGLQVSVSFQSDLLEIPVLVSSYWSKYNININDNINNTYNNTQKGICRKIKTFW